ncbi:hypothetical protein SteCoe_12397 [Stentor coeruleus]|uniref:Major facilitator superfamily (MFS) profile domain-containing protein n=1 Tax=Stentor coeruleus TaxID=5963 RepID=A0A1R2CAV3_9CILI|nr:hypothetical protein SteCoe_12397 [Stentor coeruleus]
MNERLNAILLNIGLVLTMVVAGNINSWGTLSPYIASYFHNMDNSLTIADFVIVNSISCVFESTLGILVAYLIRFWHPFNVSCLGVSISIAILFISSYIKNPYLFCWIFGLGIGSCSATIFLPCIWIVWNQIPNNKARTGGIGLVGYNLGPMIFGLIFTMIVNPYDYQAKDIESDKDENQKIFGPEVANKVPMAIRWLAFCLLISYTIGIILLKRKWKTDEGQKQAGNSTMTFCEMLKSIRAWNLFFFTFFSVACLTYITNTYKIIGMLYINNDHYAAFIGSAGSCAGCIGCILLGFLFDKYSWKKVVTCDCLLLIIFYITFQVSLDSKYLYGFYIISIYFLSFGGYIGTMVQTEIDFPEDKWILAYVGLGLIPAYTTPYILEKFITPEVGYFFTFIIIAGFTAIAMFQSIFHPTQYKVEENASSNLITTT